MEKQSSLFPKGGGDVSGILIDSEIEEAVNAGYLISRDTFQRASVEASSYDVSVGRRGILGGVGIEIDLTKEPMELGPGGYGGVLSLECFDLPEHICARIGSKRALSYDGVILLTGSLVDPGYRGHLLFGLYNASQRRVIIRHGRKLCNVVFERLGVVPSKQAPSDPNLRIVNLPDTFVDRMANMEVLPWMQISERVKQIEQITREILDLKARYEDVLQPIRDLTKNVDNLTKDVSGLTAEATRLTEDMKNLSGLVNENGKQISQLTANMGTLLGQVQAVQERTRSMEDAAKVHTESISTLRVSFSRFQVIAYIFWALVLLGLGALLPELVKRFLASN